MGIATCVGGESFRKGPVWTRKIVERTCIGVVLVVFDGIWFLKSTVAG